MVICEKKQKRCEPDDIAVGDCWLGISLADESGLVLSLRVGKHTDAFLQELVANTEGKTDCKLWCTDDWGGYVGEAALKELRVLPSDVTHYIGKENTQRLERTNGIVRQQTGRWLSLRQADANGDRINLASCGNRPG